MAQTTETALPPLGKDGDLPPGIYRATLRETLHGGEEQAISGWQIKRDGTRRGIIEIVEEQT